MTVPCVVHLAGGELVHIPQISYGNRREVLAGLLVASAMLLPYWRTLGTVGFVFAAAIALYMVLTILVSLLGFSFTNVSYLVPTIGASGASYGLLLAYALSGIK